MFLGDTSSSILHQTMSVVIVGPLGADGAVEVNIVGPLDDTGAVKVSGGGGGGVSGEVSIISPLNNGNLKVALETIDPNTAMKVENKTNESLSVALNSCLGSVVVPVINETGGLLNVGIDTSANGVTVTNPTGGSLSVSNPVGGRLNVGIDALANGVQVSNPTGGSLYVATSPSSTVNVSSVAGTAINTNLFSVGAGISVPVSTSSGTALSVSTPLGGTLAISTPLGSSLSVLPSVSFPVVNEVGDNLDVNLKTIDSSVVVPVTGTNSVSQPLVVGINSVSSGVVLTVATQGENPLSVGFPSTIPHQIYDARYPNGYQSELFERAEVTVPIGVSGTNHWYQVYDLMLFTASGVVDGILTVNVRFSGFYQQSNSYRQSYHSRLYMQAYDASFGTAYIWGEQTTTELLNPVMPVVNSDRAVKAYTASTPWIGDAVTKMFGQTYEFEHVFRVPIANGSDVGIRVDYFCRRPFANKGNTYIFASNCEVSVAW